MDTLIKSVDLPEIGEKVTTYSNMGGVGFGYLVNGVVYVNSGSYVAREACSYTGGLKKYVKDNGKGYLEFIKSL